MATISPRICSTTRKQHFDYSYAATTTTNDYAALDTIDLRGRTDSTIRLENTHVANSITYKVLGSIDGTNFDITVQAETAVIAGDIEIVCNLTYYIAYAKVYIKSTVAATHGTALVDFICM